MMTKESCTDILLQIRHLKTYFFSPYGVAKAVDDVNFRVKKGESFGLIGESGCGKSTIALSIMKMLQGSARIVDGEILLDQEDIIRLSRSRMKQVWGAKLFMVFQDPATSLNPLMKIGKQINEVLKRKEGRKLSKDEMFEKGIEVLQKVDLPDSGRLLNQYPHQLSGGMKQRVMIGMGICLSPSLLILDEPTTALDSTVQFKIIELIAKIKREYRMSQLIITHDFGVAAKLCDKIAVMYAGKIVEQGEYVSLLEKPLHPYTQGLFKCVIKPDIQVLQLEIIRGSVPSLYKLLQGCYFENRCEISMPICRAKEPRLFDLGDGHLVACHAYGMM